ncbi:DUF448 domain-containing protein [Sphingomonas canadensis]|uniref:DUF448 domain-containing protein n=1 Tax=Sphingomonas canadensis TaxID=1219257 RepID=A0ABW3H567_9SPHN|nr:DUF448 domain-containing protein [Sphingomonas canadensis]MCW3834595.1 DUF448 domain-containing protein [Sphingomonas canadensis]
MRTPSNETGSLADSAVPERTCVLSREQSPREGLIRLALSPDGEVLPDVRAKAPGRGAWIGAGRAELEEAMAKGRLKAGLARAFRTGDLRIPQDLPDRIGAALERAFLDRLGLEAKAGYLLTGSERIEAAARSGQLQLLLHAADARADGAARLAQAWRVGSEREGSGLKGLTLPAPRAILSLALGRENVVHCGLTDHRAALRVREALDRWLQFIGPERAPKPCETGSQGASALPAEARTDEQKNTQGTRAGA